MHAALGREQAVRVRAVHDERRALDPGLVAVQHLVDLDVEVLPLRPPQVHAEQHLGPVLRFGSAGAGVERGDRVVVVVLAAEERRELQLLEVPRELVDRAAELGGQLRVGLVLEQLAHGARVAQPKDEGVVAVELGAKARQARGQPPSAIGVVPERGVGGLLLELGHLSALAVDVKGTPSRRRCARRGPRAARCARSFESTSYRPKAAPLRRGVSVYPEPTLLDSSSLSLDSIRAPASASPSRSASLAARIHSSRDRSTASSSLARTAARSR